MKPGYTMGTVLAIILLTLPLLTACGSDDETAETPELIQESITVEPDPTPEPSPEIAE